MQLENNPTIEASALSKHCQQSNGFFTELFFLLIKGDSNLSKQKHALVKHRK